MTGDQDDGQFSVNRLDPCKELKAIDLRHSHIRDDDAVISRCNTVQGIQSVRKICNIETGQLERLPGGAPQRPVIVDQNNGR